MRKTGGEAGAAFKEAYASLNAAQKQAVDTIDGPVMVIAGPGTGKTQILTLRIAKILLETDLEPDNILALTFTEAGAKAMRERLRGYIGAAAYRVAIFTFHGFSERLIREYPDAYQKVIGGRPASDLDKITILESILDDPQFKLLRPAGNPSYYIPALRRTLGMLKQEYITPDRLAEIIAKQEKELAGIEKIHSKGAHKGKVRSEYTKKEKAITKNRELLSVYKLYEASLREQNLYDFEDMIAETVAALTANEDMLRDLQETYQYVLADEHQDVNGSQNKILELFSNFHDNPNIFVVGDEKQAIYRFQGASLENFLYFTDLFPKAVQIDLTENYRSGQSILDAAHSLVEVEDGPLKNLRVPLTATTAGKAVIEQRTFSHQGVEDTWVVTQVQQALGSGTAPEEIAVIVRTNREVEALAAQLRRASVTTEASADSDILDHPITHTVQNLIATTVQSDNEQCLFQLLHDAYWGLPAIDVVKIAKARSYDRPLRQILSDETVLQELGVSEVAVAKNISETVATAQKMSTNEPPQRVLEYLLTESGFLTHIMEADPVDGGRVVRRLYDEVEKMVLHDRKATLREVQAVLQSYRAHNLALTAPFIASSTAAVQVMTAHKSKGLEFAVVIVPHVVDSIWGGGRTRTDFDIPLTRHVAETEFEKIDDERRLLYVAMTRAKQKLCLSNSEENLEGKGLVASRLLEDIDDKLLPAASTEAESAAFDPLAPLQYQSNAAAIDADFLKTHLSERGLSATSFNNYLASPYTYLYRNVLRAPETQTSALQFGTAIHGVMEWVSASVAKSGELPNMSQVKKNLETQLGRLPIGAAEFTRQHEKGLEALSAYLAACGSSLKKDSKVEFSVSVELPTGLSELPMLPLTGKLDRLDVDETGRVVRVVDYKTGKPKTRNDIEGKTKNSRGDYKRQLIFYALLLSLLDEERYQCRTGVLSFIQPGSKGEVKEETFEITDEEIEALKVELVRVAEEIITGKFLETPCDAASSEYCELAERLFRK